MFCFGRRAERQQQQPGTMSARMDDNEAVVIVDDVVSDISSDGKYMVDIPTPKEFSLATLHDIRFIDSDRRESEDAKESPRNDGEEVSWGDADEVFLSGAPPPPKIVVHDEPVERTSSASTADIGRLFSVASSRQSSMESSLDAVVDVNGMTSDACSEQGRSPAPGPRFKLLHEGDIQVCRLNRARSVVGKIFSSKLLRRWENHHLVLGDTGVVSKTPVGIFETPLQYAAMEEIYAMNRLDSDYKYCLHIAMFDGSLLLQVKNSYIRDQWYHSIMWKKNLHKYRNVLLNANNDVVLLKDLKSFIDYVMITPLQDECFTSGPLEIISELLSKNEWVEDDGEEILIIAGSIIGTATMPESLAVTLGKICRNHSLSAQTKRILHHAARHILKHNVDFGKAPHLRRFLQDYISALYRSPGGYDTVRVWIGTVHGPGFNCPHPRTMPNLAAVCFAAFNSIPPLASPESSPAANDGSLKREFSDFDNDQLINNNVKTINDSDPPTYLDTSNIDEAVMNDRNKSYSSRRKKSNNCEDTSTEDMVCFANIINFMSSYADWAEGLSAVLQPVPIPGHVIQSKSAFSALANAVVKLGTDERCAVHSHLLPSRSGRPGWLQILCPTYNNPEPERLQHWGGILGTLLNCCCKRKCFLVELAKMLPACLLLALRAHPAGLESLCLMLEWEVLDDEQARVEAVQALRSTPSGQKALQASCQRQVHLKKLQQKGGPRRLTLPSCATDADVARLLSAGSFGNLECLSLAFTHVTSSVAEQLIKLPSLRYLNLWATQFGDAGVLLIVEHLHRLQVLNLCETPVTDTGIEALSALENLRKLNLNSTKLSAATWTQLKTCLPALQEWDVRYTDAW